LAPGVFSYIWNINVAKSIGAESGNRFETDFKIFFSILQKICKICFIGGSRSGNEEEFDLKVTKFWLKPKDTFLICDRCNYLLVSPYNLENLSDF
jgi:hypothetical protein